MITLDLSPLSVNRAFYGKHIKTAEHRKFCEDVSLLLNNVPKNMYTGYVQVTYKFYLDNFKKTDLGNLEKCLTDILVQNQIIPDDRFVVVLLMTKYPSKLDRIEIEIQEANDYIKENICGKCVHDNTVVCTKCRNQSESHAKDYFKHGGF